MSGLAQVLRRRGQIVTGSDKTASPTTERLEELGIAVHIGHDVESMPEQMDCLVVSAAVKADNPELAWAVEHGIPVFKYAELLGHLTRQMPTLAVSGTHGKSTSSGWLAYMLHQAGRSPSFVVGAHVTQLNAGSGAGTGGRLVVEACEYDRSFLNLHPWAAAILNIEADHLDYYKDLDEIVESFSDFASRVQPTGLLVSNSDDPLVRRAIQSSSARCESFGLNGSADWQPGNLAYENGMGRFDLLYQGRNLGRVKLTLAGRHNVANSLAVAALSRLCGLSDNEILAGLDNYGGVGRRMTFKGTAAGVTILDDYAHHPTEISVTLEAIRSRYQPRKLWCVFQPHQHSRTRFLLNDFALSFQQADVILLPEIYFVRDSEELRREVSARQLAEKIGRQGGEARFLPEFEEILEYLCRQVKPGDLVVTMGAGNIGNLADELICRLGRDC